jgi:hypothetical protein
MTVSPQQSSPRSRSYPSRRSTTHCERVTRQEGVSIDRIVDVRRTTMPEGICAHWTARQWWNGEPLMNSR